MLVAGSVVVGRLVEEFSRFTEHYKTVGKPFRNPELLLVFSTEMGANPPPEGF